MKKSELYHLAQIAVVTSPCIAPERKLKVLKVLVDDEELSLFREKWDAEKECAEA